MTQQILTRPARGDDRPLSALGPAPDPHATVPEAKLGDLVDLWGRDSFPASDPPSNW